MTFRVYNEGVAFNYTFLPQNGKESLTIEKELTEFNMPENYDAWVANRAQAEYRKIPVNEITEPTERPLVIKAEDHFLATGEAKLVDFSRMKLQAGEKENSLVAVLHDAPTVELPYTTPWRTIMIGDSPGELLENNYFLLNLMTQEGIRGDEESPSNTHTLITLFTRMLAGAGDNTICYYAPRVTEKMGGHVSQLAKAVMLYSPWQFLFWYDRPPSASTNKGAVPGSDGYIQDDPELRFFKEMPTVWDETKVLEGKIGEYATVARRADDEWFLGSLTGKNPKKVELDLSFLDSGENYQAIIYTRDENSSSSTNVAIEKREVNSDSQLSFEIAANSGLAMHFQKK